MLVFLEVLALFAVYALSWAAVCHALLTKHDPRAALGWTASCLLLPLAGPLVYFLFGISRAESRASAIMRRQAALTPAYAHPPASPPAHLPENVKSMERIGRHLTGQRALGGNAVTPLINGDQAYPAMLAAIASAQKHVFLTTYIFNAGRVAAAFCAALAAAARRGVDVRLLVDGVGQFYAWHKPWKKLPSSGVKCALFLPPKLLPPNWSLNLRNHRKMLICDSQAFTGGMNIADENTTSGPAGAPKVQDMHFCCQGPIVNQLRRAFLLNWGFCTNEYTPLPAGEEGAPQGPCHCRIIMDGPGSDADILDDIYCGAVNASRRIVRIMTPYFLPSHGLTQALRSAAQRGVDVRVILPAKNNLPYVHWATFRLLPTLLEAGVRVWYQPPPFAHTKLLAIDGYYAQVGSANLDARSLRLNFELNMEVFEAMFHDSVAAHMEAARAKAREITLHALRRQPLPVKLRNAACWIFSPYL